ncbi:hypothetical protein DVG78_11070 [Runella aurantiaca]|uniref:Uncharacterized protein n=1 Tax=Runella aurantiaca TaxID=2282308 RepID=A0A369IAQ2_9BACT|nr:hypothetical protein DVG78_11070 [Runella aurantiaca]
MASLQRSEANAKLPYSIILYNELNKDNAKLYKWRKNMSYNYFLQKEKTIQLPSKHSIIINYSLKQYTNTIPAQNIHAFYFINYVRIRPPMQVPRLFHGIFFGSEPLFERIFSL